MSDDLIIGFQANTSKFQMDVEKAFKVVSEFANKTGDASRSVDQAFKRLSQAAANAGGEIQKSFNSLNINSDFTMKLQQDQLQRARQFFQAQFEAIGNDANSSAADVMRAFRSLNNIEATLNATALKSEFQTLGIQSAASIEAAKIKIVNAFQEIKTSGTASASDIVRANEAMTAKLSELDKQLVTSAQRTASERRAAFNEANGSSIMSSSGAANTLIGQPLAGTQFSSSIKAQMQEAAAFAQTRSTEMASYAASAMQGEAAAARLVGQTQAGAQFASQLKSQMEGTATNTAKAHEGMSGFSLASVTAIAKIQILYSLINNVMGAIASAPGIAVEAIASFQSSVIKNAAMVTSMQGSVKDIGLSYKENKQYAEGVQNVLIKMDAETAAGAKQLQLMNDQFVQQGILIDVNNKKQIDGFKNIANALAAITSGDQNKDMQFSQEIRALRDMNARPGDRLVQILESMDPLIKAHMEEWRKIAKETGNYGLVLEKIGPMLQGFAAAQGDINNLWETVKTTMVTIRDQVLRGGLSEGFGEIVAAMKEVSKYATENKEKIQAFIKEGFADAKAVGKFIWDWRDAFIALGKASIFLAVTTGISSVIEKIKLLDATFKAGALYKLMSNPITALGVGAIYGGYKAVSQVNSDNQLNDEAKLTKQIAKQTSVFGSAEPSQLNAKHMGEFKNAFPLDGPELLALALNKGAATLSPDKLNGGTDMYKLKMNIEEIKKLREGTAVTPYPKDVKTGGKAEQPDYTEYNEAVKSYNELILLMDKYEVSTIKSSKAQGELASKIEAVNTELSNDKTKLAKANLFGQDTQDMLDYLDAITKVKIENLTLADTKKGQAELDKAENSASLSEYKTNLANQESALKEHYAAGLLTTIAFYEKMKQLIKDNSSTEIDSLNNSLNKATINAIDPNLSRGDELKAWAEVVKIEEQLSKVRDDASKKLNDNSRQSITALESEKRNFQSIQIQMLDLVGKYELAAISKKKFEETDPNFLKLPEDVKKLKSELSEYEIQLGKFKDAKEQVGIFAKLQNSIGGNNYGSNFGAIGEEHNSEISKLQAQYDQKLLLKEDFNRKMLDSDTLYSTQKASLEIQMVSDSLSVAKEGFAGNKTMQLAILAMETGIAISRIMINAEVAKMAATASAAMLGPIAGPVAAAAQISLITASEVMSIGIVGASAAIKGMSIAGGRANGGDVTAGQTYIINENRKSEGPEYFTPGVSGTITPASKMGGSSFEQHVTIDARGTDSSVLLRIDSAMKQAKEQAKAEILNDMNRGGQFALASGRMRG